MAAWEAYCAEGYVWEAFSYVCDGQANTADEIFEGLSHRGYSKGEYADALLELVKDGHLEEDNEEANYRVSDKGRQVREMVEGLTDEYFYGPWSVLPEDKQQRLALLLTQLRDTLRSFASAG